MDPIYHAHRNDIFPGFDGSPHPRPGALQLVFSDLGTPKDDAWNVYDALRALLVERGLPRELVRFMHEARDDREKGELFAACRDGRVAVLIGSTQRMGVGTNVQLRATALHHLDCPWRPADLAQREGRILRQGNACAEIEIVRYVTEGSFDGYLWQTVARKATFIAQVMRGRLDVREIEDIGDAALSYNEVKALAAGNPLLLEHARVQAEVTRLERLERAHANKRSSLRWTVGQNEQAIARRRVEITQLDAALARQSSALDQGVTVQGHACKTGEGNKMLRQALMEFAAHSTRVRKQGKAQAATTLGTANGFEIRAAPGILDASVVLELVDVPGTEVHLGPEELHNCMPLTRLEKRIADLAALRRDAEWQVHRLGSELARAREELERPFRHAELLTKTRAELREIDLQLQDHITPVQSVATEGITSQHEASAVATAPVQLDPEARWRSALEQERAAIMQRATSLSARLKMRAAKLDRVLQELRISAPERPGILGLGAKAYRRWEDRCRALEARRLQLLGHDHQLSEYLIPEHVQSIQSKCTALAVRRVGEADPALLASVQEHRIAQARMASGGKESNRRARTT